MNMWMVANPVEKTANFCVASQVSVRKNVKAKDILTEHSKVTIKDVWEYNRPLLQTAESL